MAKPREARGWFVYAIAVGVAYLMLAFRLYYAPPATPSPSVLLPWIDVPFLIAILAGALATIGLQQGLWYALVRPTGRVVFGASFLAFVVATLLFYGLPAHLATPTLFYLMFAAGLGLFLIAPALSYDSREVLGIALAGSGLLVVGALWSVITGQESLVPGQPTFRFVFLVTFGAEGLLALTILRLIQLKVKQMRAVPA